MRTNDIPMKTNNMQNKTLIFRFSNSVIFKLFLLIVAALSFQACSQDNEKTSTPKPKKVPLVQVQAVTQTPLVSFIETTGTIEANISTDITAPSDGILEELSVRENQFAQKDKVIAVINPHDRVALISDNQLTIQKLESQLKKFEQDTEEHQSIVQKIQQAKNDLEYAKNMYQTIPVICPMSGLVTQRYTDIGSQVSAKDKIITISDMNSLVIKARINEKYFEALKKGQKFDISLNAYPNDSVKGIVNLIYPTIDPENRTVEFDIKVTGFSKKLLPGMMASIKIPVSKNENALAVPEHAVLTSPDGKNFLFVADSSGVAHKLQVQKGIASGKLVEIKQGLKPGDKVVVAGQEMLKDGVKVKIMK